jgi:hypothetical protein
MSAVSQSKLATIPILLCARSPLTVFGRIIAVVIQSFQRQLWRFWTHVVQEKLEGRTPAFTNADTPPAIALVSRIFWILAATYHGTPSIVFSGAATLMSYVAYASQFLIKATARAGMPAAKRGLMNNGFNAAVAFAFPSSEIFPWLDFFEHGKPPIGLTDQIHFHASNCIRGDWRVKPL